MFSLFFTLLKRHKYILLFGALLTLLVCLPTILFPFLAGDAYRGINIAHFGTDEHYYLTRAKEILEGHGLGNIALREGKDAQEPQFTYAEYAFLLPVRALGMADAMNVVTLYNIFAMVSVFFLIICVYVFSLELKDDRRFALAAALCVVGGYTIIYNKTIGSPELNIYERAVFPVASSIAFFIFARFLLRSLKSGSRTKAIWAGVWFGVLFYVFFFAWSFALALLGSMCVIFLAKRDGAQVKKIMAIGGIGLLFGAYNLVRLYLFYGTGNGRQLAFFLWSFSSHAPIMSKIGTAMALFLGLYWYRHRHDGNRLIAAGFVLAGWVSLNQQMITGRVIQYGHYYWFFIVPTSIVLGVYMVWSFLPSERARSVGAIVLVLVVFLNSGIGQYRAAFVYLAAKQNEQRYVPSIAALRNVDARRNVVMAPDGAPGLLTTIYTRHDVLWNSVALVYNTPIERMEDMLVWYLYINKDARSDPRGFLERALADPEEASDAKMLYIAIEGVASGLDSHAYAALTLARDPALLRYRARWLDAIEKKVRAFSSAPGSVDAFLETYGLGYIVWDIRQNPKWDMSVFSGLQEISSSDGVRTYAISPSSS